MKRLGEPPYICLITEGRASSKNYYNEKPGILGTLRQAVSDGVTLIQIREKALPARLLYDLANEAVKLAAKSEVVVIVNGRADIALAAGADGVHLPGDSIPLDVVRRAFPSDLVIGVSTHSIAEARAAAENSADYIFFGPVFDTPGKGPAVGLSALQNVCQSVGQLPVIAIGGIDQNNYDLVVQAGAAGVAAIRALNAVESRRHILHGLSRTGIR